MAFSLFVIACAVSSLLPIWPIRAQTYACGGTMSGTTSGSSTYKNFDFYIDASYDNVTIDACNSEGNNGLSIWHIPEGEAHTEIWNNDGNTDCVLPGRELPVGDFLLNLQTRNDEYGNYEIKIICRNFDVVVDVDTNGGITDEAEAEDFVDNVLFDAILFAAGYALLILGFCIAMSCCKKLDNSLKIKLFLLMITLILEAMDVSTDIAQVNSMSRGSSCGISTCIRQGKEYGKDMVPFIICGAVITFFGTVVFFYLSFKNIDDPRVLKAEMCAELLKFWLEDIPILLILIMYQTDGQLDPNNKDAFVPYVATDVLYVSLIFTGVDFVFAMAMFCKELFCGEHFQEETQKKQKKCFGICLTLTGAVVLILYLIIWIVSLQQGGKNSFAAVGVNDYCIGAAEDSEEGSIWYSVPGSGGYQIAFTQTASQISLKSIDTPSDSSIVYTPNDCTYADDTLPASGQCATFNVDCSTRCEESDSDGCVYFQLYTYKVENLTICADVCVD